MVNANPVSGIYSATYSGIPVYEFQFGGDCKEHVMRRRHDDWINATHILKAAGFDKPARTRILERDVQKEVHEKIQGGYGKYQGTWIPLDAGEGLARRHSIYEKIRPIFEFVPGNESPPPAPRHANKPKAPKARPPLPKWNNNSGNNNSNNSGAVPAMAMVEEYEAREAGLGGEEDTPDNLTVASASFMAEDDRFDVGGHPSTGQGQGQGQGQGHASTTGQRKRKRVVEEQMQDMTEQQHAVYGDELLDYFLLSRNEQPAVKPEPPPNFQPNWLIDAENHTALHWASAMGDIDVIKQLRRFNADVSVKNVRGETPFMRSVNFTNCYEKQSFPSVMKELFDTADVRDTQGCTVIHHAAIMKNGRVYSPSCSRYYLDNILNRLQETLEPGAFQQLLDVQDSDGNTALHLAAQRNARKCIRALLGRNASTDIANNEGVRAEDLIMELNAVKKDRGGGGGGGGGGPQRSSSPFAPADSHSHSHSLSLKDAAFCDGGGGGFTDNTNNNNSNNNTNSRSRSNKWPPTFQSAAATTVQTRISPLIMEKFQDLAKSYDDEWREKDLAEMEAKRILTNTQAELSAARQQIAELEAQTEPDDVAAKIIHEAALASQQVLSLIMNQNKLHIHQIVETEMARLGSSSSSSGETLPAPVSVVPDGPGEEAQTTTTTTTTTASSREKEVDNDNNIIHNNNKNDNNDNDDNDNTYAGRLALARQLSHTLAEQREAELEYVEALSMVGVGDKIEKYRRLLRRCLDPKDGEILDNNLDNLIEMMEEEKQVHELDEPNGGGPEPMDFATAV